MKHIPLPDNVIIHTGFTDLFVVTEADLDTLATNTSKVLNLLSLAIGDTVMMAHTWLKTPLKNSADAAFNTCAATLGDTGSANRFITSQELNANGTTVTTKAGANTTNFVYTAADTLQLTVASMAGKALNDLDTGELHIYVNIARMARLATLV